MQYASPGVYVEVSDRSSREIYSLRTDITGVVGIAERGPLDQPIAVETWSQFESVFGGYLPNAHLAYAAKGFFENGGRRLVVVRVAAPGPKVMSDGPQTERTWTSVSSTDGFVEGAVATISQASSSGVIRLNRLIERVDTVRGRLVWQAALDEEVDLGLPFEVASGVAVASAHASNLAAEAVLRFEATSPGSWGNQLSVAAFARPFAATVAPSTDQAFGLEHTVVASTVGLTPGTVVRISDRRADQYRLVSGIDEASRTVHWDRPLRRAIASTLAEPLSLEAMGVEIRVFRGEQLLESFSRLSVSDQHVDFVESATAGSQWLRAYSAGPGGANWELRLPDSPTEAFPLTGGRDGITALTQSEFIGARLPDGRRTGIASLADVDEVGLLVVPDLMLHPEPSRVFAPLRVPEPDPCRCPPDEPGLLAASGVSLLVERAPNLSNEQVFEIQQALVAQCEAQGDRFAILDAPGECTTATPALRSSRGPTLSGVVGWRRRFDTSFAAIYYPWIRVQDPLTPRTELVRSIPPSAHLAGLFARTDLEVGVHKAPANESIRWVRGLTAALTRSDRELLHENSVCALRAFSGRGIRPYGARTLSSDSQLRFINVRRLVSMIREAVDEALQWAVFEPNNFFTRRSISLSLTTFLRALFRGGALAGQQEEEAFFVKCDPSNNPQVQIDLGRLWVDVGVAPVRPAEFVVVRFGRATEGFATEELALSGAGVYQ